MDPRWQSIPFLLQLLSMVNILQVHLGQLWFMMRRKARVRREAADRKTLFFRRMHNVQTALRLMRMRKMRYQAMNTMRNSPKVWRYNVDHSTHWFNLDFIRCCFDDSRWIKEFRLPRKAVENLCELVGPEMKAKEGPCRRDTVPVFKRVCVALWALAHSSKYATVARGFGLSKSTVCRYVQSFCNILKKKRKHFISWPSNEEAERIAQQIEERTGYPQAFGALAGCQMTAGLDCLRNRKMWPSLVMQAVADDRYMFRDVCIKHPVSCHNASVFEGSWLGQNLTQVVPQSSRRLCEVDVPLHILCDPAYPLHTHLIRAYPCGADRDEAADSYNVYHNSVRDIVEVAFGKLKSRWRRCGPRMNTSHKCTPTVILACAILHNVAQSLGLDVDPELEQERLQEDQSFECPVSNSINDSIDEDPSDISATIIRDAIRDHLASVTPLCLS